jgi:tRNA threonylcarbamoyladenosine biosynthesis protein TsaB
MNILSIDTTTKNAEISIKKGSIIFEENVNNEITHSEKLLPLIDKTLQNADLKLQDIDLFACINGPGSFTGIRIGLSTLKAFAHVENKNIFAINTLDSLNLKTYLESQNYIYKQELYIASLIDAKNDRVYFNFSKLSLNEENKVCIETIYKLSNLYINEAAQEILKKCQEKNINNLVFSTDISEKVSEILKDSFEKVYISFKIIVSYPNATDLFKQIENISNIQKYTFNAFTLNAIYARLSQAERVQKNEK